MPSYYLFFSKAPDMFLMSSCVLKKAGLYDDLLFLSSLFHFFYFIFSVSISMKLCFPISPSLLLLLFLMFSQTFVRHGRKTFGYIYINGMHFIHTHTHTHIYIYISENLWTFALLKHLQHFFIPLVWLSMIEV